MKDDRARIYHHPAWISSLSNSYGGRPFYVLLVDNRTGQIEGVAPFILFNNKSKTKKKIISLPFTNYCDFILPENYDVKTILNYIEQQIGHISIFDLRNLDQKIIEGFSNSCNFLLHVIELKPTLEETYKSFGRRSIRRFIKKAEENNLAFRLGETEDDFQIFYNLEVNLRKSIGLPPAPYYFFHNIWSNLKKENLVFLPIVSSNDIPITASLVLHFKDRIYFEYTGMSKKHKNLYGNHKIHWEMIKFAQNELGSKYVELGRVSNDHKDLIFFKENWNAAAFNVYHKRCPVSPNQNPLAGFRKITYNIFRNINKKLPKKILELEGRAMYKYLKYLFFFCLLLK